MLQFYESLRIIIILKPWFSAQRRTGTPVESITNFCQHCWMDVVVSVVSSGFYVARLKESTLLSVAVGMGLLLF